MSAATDLALPQDIEIDGKRCKLYPLSLYEIGLLERSYAAAMRREALESTIGFPDEREHAMQQAANKIGELAISAVPVIAWVCNSWEGRIIALKHCIDASVSERQVSRWLQSSSLDEQVVKNWEVDSGIRPDPTETEETEEGKSQLSENSGTEQSPEAASAGSTDSEPKSQT